MKVTTVFNWLTSGNITEFTSQIYDALRELVQFVQVKKREKHPWESIAFSKVATVPSCINTYHYNFGSWWNGLKYEKLNASRREYEFSMK